MFKNAIVRTPGANFAQGLTTVVLIPELADDPRLRGYELIQVTKEGYAANCVRVNGLGTAAGGLSAAYS